MNFVAVYDAMIGPGDRDVVITPVGLFDNDEEHKAAVFKNFLAIDPKEELCGVLFSYAGTVYEYRWLEGRWLLAVHGAGEYFFTLMCADGSAWQEDLLIIASGTNSHPTWPVINP